VSGPVTFHHKWALLLKQQFLITVNPLPNKQTNSIFHFSFQQTNGRLPFSFSVYNKQMEAAIFYQFRFPFSVQARRSLNIHIASQHTLSPSSVLPLPKKRIKQVIK
jgi:hypothetical protein